MANKKVIDLQQAINLLNTTYPGGVSRKALEPFYKKYDVSFELSGGRVGVYTFHSLYKRIREFKVIFT